MIQLHQPFIQERNYGCRIEQWGTYKGMRTIVMQNEFIRLSLLLDKGTDIYELLYKPLDIDFLWRSPQGIRHPNDIPSISNPEGVFADVYPGGWQEVFPSGSGPSVYRGAWLGFHGEVAVSPWEYEIMINRPDFIEVKLTTRTLRTPFILEKKIAISARESMFTIDEQVLNYGKTDLHYMWGHHPSFGGPFLSEDCILNLPPCTVFTHPQKTGEKMRFLPRQQFQWPEGLDADGNVVDLRQIPGKNLAAADMLYAADYTEGWFALTNLQKGVGIGMVWDVSDYPYMWIWQEFGGTLEHPWYGNAYTLAVEPFTSLPGKGEHGLQESIANGTAALLRAGSVVRKKLKVVIYESKHPVKRIALNGQVERDHA